MDAITLLKNDHKTVNDLFKKFEKAGDSAYKTKAKLVEQIVHELAVHAAIEEVALYPYVKGVSSDLTDDVLESLEEHHVVKWLLSEIEGMDPKDERFDAKVTVLIENVRHHVKEEEQEMFPRLRQELSRTQLQELGDALASAKKVAPTHPHPRSPDEPPFNAIASVIAGMIDRARDTGRKTLAGTRR
jgi:hemerythrin superfamily protein